MGRPSPELERLAVSPIGIAYSAGSRIRLCGIAMAVLSYYKQTTAWYSALRLYFFFGRTASIPLVSMECAVCSVLYAKTDNTALRVGSFTVHSVDRRWRSQRDPLFLNEMR